MQFFPYLFLLHVYTFDTNNKIVYQFLDQLIAQQLAVLLSTPKHEKIMTIF